MPAVIVYDYLLINNKKITVEQLDQVPKEVTENEGIRFDDKHEVGVFYGRDCIFSNFYPSKLHYDGLIFHSAEQLLQYKKAIFADNHAAAKKIIESQSPSECKRVGDKIKMDEQKKRRWMDTFDVRSKFKSR